MIVDKIKTIIYVDDLISGDFSQEEFLELKEVATKIFKAGGFTATSG